MLTLRGWGRRWRDSFDLVPDVGERREHTLAFEYERGGPTRSERLALAKRWGVAAAEGLIDAVVASIAQFTAVAEARWVLLRRSTGIVGQVGPISEPIPRRRREATWHRARRRGGR